MNEKNKKSKKEEVDFGIGKFGLGGLFKGIANLIDLVAKMEEEGKTEITRRGEIKGLGEKFGRKDIKGVYGFTIRTGLGERGRLKPRIEPFGNIRETKKGPEVVETREPITDVFDEKDQVRVIAELPGADPKDIQTKIEGDILILEAKGDKNKYFKEILLPSLVEEKIQETSFKNGVLELKLKKTTAHHPPGKKT